MNNSLDEVKECWEKETDNYLVKAATIDLHEYPPEVQEIIKNEVKKRGLKGAKFTTSSIAKEITDEFIGRDHVAFFNGFVEKYSYISKFFRPAIILLSTYCGVLGILIAEALKRLFYKEIEPEERIICRKKGKKYSLA